MRDGEMKIKREGEDFAGTAAAASFFFHPSSELSFSVSQHRAKNGSPQPTIALRRQHESSLVVPGHERFALILASSRWGSLSPETSSTHTWVFGGGGELNAQPIVFHPHENTIRGSFDRGFRKLQFSRKKTKQNNWNMSPRQLRINCRQEQQHLLVELITCPHFVHLRSHQRVKFRTNKKKKKKRKTSLPAHTYTCTCAAMVSLLGFFWTFFLA